MGPDPAVAEVRSAVRRTLEHHPQGPVLVACSGGVDSLALLAAAIFEARTTSRPVVGVTVDHGLQDDSAAHAETVVAQMADLGASETVTVRVRVESEGRGIEAAAREARYAVLEEVAERSGSDLVLLGHTADDQAETVLLGLTRGSGGRSIAGMRRSFGPFVRPLLDLTRTITERACQAQGIAFWTDPHNSDERFTRARIRHDVLPVLERELGPGVAATLARTADQLREDMDYLDLLATQAYAAVAEDSSGQVIVDVEAAARLDTALRRRVLRQAAVRAGASPAELFRVHVLALDDLVLEWHGQRRIQLPGHTIASRTRDTLTISRSPVAG